MKQNPKFYYHVTPKKNWKSRMTLFPRSTDECEERPVEEPDLARICVAPTIEQCLVAICVNSWSSYKIYRTVRKVTTLKPWDVLDAHITGERWIVKPTRFMKVMTLPVYVIEDVSEACFMFTPGSGEKNDEKEEKKAIKKVRSILRLFQKCS